jgi:hypothetical protein
VKQHLRRFKNISLAREESLIMFSRVRWRCLESEDPREIIFDKKKNSSHIGGTQM